ncbi:hypothetical protein LC613_40010 [Nostoc sphaeroides CHAB 2801]|uniref:hypothetical protein n=1 Tax=Nostoc sphaeroides TaxID=446679 RepID=UPI001E2F8216|nr:hypothetical protein [Nostoc sphaeroides]MCC5633624.1 hypothetical protein [Nostoc sphaeroides CHAB 2801]
MTATITRPKLKKSTASKKESPYKRLHVIIPIEDMLWASQQKPSVNQLWQECWTADPYGSRWMPLSTGMGYSTFISAKKILSDSGLFIFKPDKSIEDGRETVKWMVQNLHGSRMKEFWEKANAEKQEANPEKRESNTGDSEKDAGCEEMGALYEASILGESQSEQGFCETSRTAQEHLTNSTKEIVRCISDTLTRISHEEETASAPLGGASPQTVESVSELEEELPAVTDCTTLTLVDVTRSQPASLRDAARTLLAENQNCGVEQKGCHEDTCSAAPVAKNEFSSSLAIANQTPGQVEQGQSAFLPGENQVSGVEMKADHKGTGSGASPAQIEFSSTSAMPAAGVAIADQKIEPSRPSAELMIENSVSGVEVKADHEGTCSAISVPNPEKWSHEAIVTRSNMRPERMQKLKVARNSGQNPGFDFLQECWDDDPALQIVIKKLLAKFPQWGVAVVDGVLVD